MDSTPPSPLYNHSAGNSPANHFQTYPHAPLTPSITPSNPPAMMSNAHLLSLSRSHGIALQGLNTKPSSPQSSPVLSPAPLPQISPADPYTDPALNKLLTELDKLALKVVEPLAKDPVIKYLKAASKVFSALIKHNLFQRYVVSNYLDKHWSTLAEAFHVALLKKYEFAVLKDLRNMLTLYLAERIKLVNNPDIKGFRRLFMILTITNLSTVEETASWIQAGIQKLSEVKAEIEWQVSQEMAAFSGVGVRSRPGKSFLGARQNLDTKIAMYLVLGKKEMPSSEIEVVEDQLAKSLALLSLLNGARRLSDQVKIDANYLRVELDVYIINTVMIMFSQSLPGISPRENLALKILFSIVLKDNNWFWDKIEKLDLNIQNDAGQTILGNDEIALLTTLESKLIRKLMKGYLFKSNEYKVTRTKILDHFNSTLHIYHTTFLALATDHSVASNQVLHELLENLISVHSLVLKASKLFLSPDIFEVLIPLTKPYLEVATSIEVINACIIVIRNNKNEQKNLGRMIWKETTRLLEGGIVRAKGIAHTLGLLRVLDDWVIYCGYLNKYLLPLILELAHKTLEFFRGREEKHTKELVWISRIARHCLEICWMHPADQIVCHAYNSYETLGELARGTEKRLASGLLAMIEANNSTQQEQCGELLLEIALLMRVASKDTVETIEKEVEERRGRGWGGDLCLLKKIHRPETVETLETAILYCCLGFDILQLSAHKSSDKRIHELLRTSIMPPSASFLSPSDAIVSDGRSILRIHSNTISVYSSYGHHILPILNIPDTTATSRLNLTTWLTILGWTPPDLYLLDPTNKGFQTSLAILDERDSLISVKIGTMILPRLNEVRESIINNEDLERLLIRKSEVAIPEVFAEVICDMLGGKERSQPLAYKNTLAVNHLLRASLVVAPLYDKQKDRAFELKKELGNCEVNIFFDEDGVGALINDQIYKSNFTYVEIVVSKIDEIHWSVAIKCRDGMKEQLLKLQATITEQSGNKQERTVFDRTDFNDFWLSLDSKNPPILTCLRSELPSIVRSISIFFSLLLKISSCTLKDPSKIRKINIEEIVAKYGAVVQGEKDLSLTDFLLLLSSRRNAEFVS